MHAGTLGILCGYINVCVVCAHTWISSIYISRSIIKYIERWTCRSFRTHVICFVFLFACPLYKIKIWYTRFKYCCFTNFPNGSHLISPPFDTVGNNEVPLPVPTRWHYDYDLWVSCGCVHACTYIILVRSGADLTIKVHVIATSWHVIATLWCLAMKHDIAITWDFMVKSDPNYTCMIKVQAWTHPHDTHKS